MTKNAERFTGRIEEYERYRLEYPQEVVSFLRERCGLGLEHLVADVGAGTGMLAELFLENGNAVIAVEPNHEMRAACARALQRFTRLTIVDATAEAMGLEDASVDFVAAGRAFHWFDKELALAEFCRVLRPQGWVVLAANGRSHGGTKQALEYERILESEGMDYKDVKSRYQVHDAVGAFFAEGSLAQKQWHGEQALTLEEFLGQTQSYSAAPLPGHAKYEGMQRALLAHFARFERGGLLRMGTTCCLTCGQLSTR